jgi:hypothetical protein
VPITGRLQFNRETPEESLRHDLVAHRVVYQQAPKNKLPEDHEVTKVAQRIFKNILDSNELSDQGDRFVPQLLIVDPGNILPSLLPTTKRKLKIAQCPMVSLISV